MKAAEEDLEAKDKQKPSFELSGKLAEETNRVRGVTLLFTEPPDARKPDIRWRLYVFKGGEVLKDPLYVHRQTCYLFGRERRVADIPTDHPSCSKQHAVIQYRLIEKEQPDGLLSKQPRVRASSREFGAVSRFKMQISCNLSRTCDQNLDSSKVETMTRCHKFTVLEDWGELKGLAYIYAYFLAKIMLFCWRELEEELILDESLVLIYAPSYCLFSFCL